MIFYEHKFLYRRIKEEVPEQDYVVPIGKAVVRREGTDIAVITYGAMVWTALEAAGELEKEGMSLEVVDLRSLLPYDEEMVLASARKCSKVILLHEDTRTGGMAGELAAVIAEKAFEDLDGPIVRVTAPDTPVPFAPPLEEYFLPNAAEGDGGSEEVGKILKRSTAHRREFTVEAQRTTYNCGECLTLNRRPWTAGGRGVCHAHQRYHAPNGGKHCGRNDHQMDEESWRAGGTRRAAFSRFPRTKLTRRFPRRPPACSPRFS